MLEDNLFKIKKDKKFKEKGDSRYIYQNDINETCF